MIIQFSIELELNDKSKMLSEIYYISHGLWLYCSKHLSLILLEQAKFLLEKHRSYVGARLGLWGEKFCNLLNVTSNYELR